MDNKKQIACEVYSRIVGYFGQVRNWNKGKRQEYKDRKPYDFNKALDVAMASEIVSRWWNSMHAPVAPMVSASAPTNDPYTALLCGIVLQWASDYRFAQRFEYARENSQGRPWPIRKETEEFAASPEFAELCEAVSIDAEAAVKRVRGEG